ncbi:MAG: hypothetical protein AAFY26_12350 [Cyanobacteria bacterium J06638_22]
MTSLDSNNPFACEAFLLTLPRLPQPLTEEQQGKIRAVLWDIQQHKLGVTQDIEALMEQDAVLKSHYREVNIELRQQYSANERAKSAAVAGVLTAQPLELEQWAEKILRTGDDVVAAAKSVVQPMGTVVSKTRSDFWARGDRLIALSAGGATLGAMIAQVPGAIIGGILAAIFAWSSYSSKNESSRSEVTQ